MGLAFVKGKLYEYIESADENKLQALYTLVESEIDDRTDMYSEAVLATFRATSNEYRTGKMKGYNMTESLQRIKAQITQK